jgi:hypothetical protein
MLVRMTPVVVQKRRDDRGFEAELAAAEEEGAAGDMGGSPTVLDMDGTTGSGPRSGRRRPSFPFKAPVLQQTI